jgi:hypothetical protein
VIAVRLGQILTEPRSLVDEGERPRRAFFWLDVVLGAVPRVGEIVVWAIAGGGSHVRTGGEGRVRMVRHLAEPEVGWHMFPTPADDVRIEVWLDNRITGLEPGIAARFLLEDGWRLANEVTS